VWHYNVCLYFVVMLNNFCSYDIHVNIKININHGSDILLKMSNSRTKYINSSDFIIIIYRHFIRYLQLYTQKIHIATVYNVAAFLYLPFMVNVFFSRKGFVFTH
jgi:hypothetical protein